jgi:hypothetical protein
MVKKNIIQILKANAALNKSLYQIAFSDWQAQAFGETGRMNGGW